LAILLALVLTPAAGAALVTPNSVNSLSIVNGQVKAADIAKAAIKTAKLANNAVTSAKIADGTIVNVDISAAAAISASKINRSGLDADLLDGRHASAFVANDAGEIDNNDIADGAISAAKIAGTAWTSINDGSGSGLDVDLLDGRDSIDFAAAFLTRKGRSQIAPLKWYDAAPGLNFALAGRRRALRDRLWRRQHVDGEQRHEQRHQVLEERFPRTRE